MAITLGGLIQDPDSLGYELAVYTAVTTEELVVDNTNKLIKLTRIGNLTSDGVTLKCLYSKLKELWRTDATLIKYPFAMTPITDEQFEFVNGWAIDNTVNTTTRISHGGTNSGTISTFVITTTGSFITSKVAVGMQISGTGVGTGARVVSVDNATNITVSVANAGAVSGALIFWADVDYTYNLIRTGGWALKDVAGVTQEEWIGAISLGLLGAEQTTKTLTLTTLTTAATTLFVASTAGIQLGSFVVGAGIPYGTTVTSVTNATDFVISQTVTIASGAIVTIRPKDQVYYQIGADTTVAPVNAALTGQVNQAIKTYGDASHGNFDFRGSGSTLRFFVREQGYTYGKQSKTDIGVTTTTYQAYRFPVSNSSDALKITHTDVGIDANSDNTADVAPYSTMNITWYAAPQARTIGGSSYNFHVIIDADTGVGPTVSGGATAEEVYEFVQWTLRRPLGTDIDAGAATKTGRITRDLLQFVGDTLYTIYDSSDGGVYIDSFNSTDTNRLVFATDTGAQITFPYTAAGNLGFNANLVTDGANAIYRLFYKQINQADASLAFGTSGAVLVNKADNTTPISGTVSSGTISFDFDYDGNTQCAWVATNDYKVGDFYRNGTIWYKVHTLYTSGGTFGATDTTNSNVVGGPDVVLAAIGLTNSQYVQAAGVIARSISNSISAVSALERNYFNPA